MTDEERALILRLDTLEAAAFEALFAAAPRPLADALGLSVVRNEGVTALVAPRLPTTQFNRVIGLGNDRPATDADVDALLSLFRDRGVREHWVHVGPAAQPADLDGLLLRRGFTVPPRRSWAKVVRGVEPPPPVKTDLVVRELAPADAPKFSSVVLAAFGMPTAISPWIVALVGRSPFRCYAAFDGEDAVSGGLVYLDGDAAWLGLGSTLATHRGRGGQGAIMARRIVDAIDAGATVITTETGESIGNEKNASLANMYRMGFRLAASRRNFAAPPSERA